MTFFGFDLREHGGCATCDSGRLRFLFVDDGVAEVSQVFQAALHVEVRC